MNYSRALGLLLAGFAFTSCGDAAAPGTAVDSETSPTAEVSSNTPTELSDCEALWAPTRDEFSESSPNAGDGEGRRAADEAMLACLADLPESAAATESDSKNAGVDCPDPVTSVRPGEYVLVFACGPEGDEATVVRSVEGRTDPDPVTVARAYFAGPTQAETRLGIYSPLGGILGGWAFETSEGDGVLRVDFEPGAAKEIGAMGSTQGFLLEVGLRKSLLPVSGSEKLVVSEDGACEPIWATAGMSCPEMTRE